MLRFQENSWGTEADASYLRAMDYRLKEGELSTAAFSIALHVLSREPASHL